ncbi:unnamed protein product [marine sediment metagenome]|uniref:Uncharacterized protein n=1 Tax=marine sediment metagenome TaxID=412755 RepID=X0YSW3_9ZZZZ
MNVDKQNIRELNQAIGIYVAELNEQREQIIHLKKEFRKGFDIGVMLTRIEINHEKHEAYKRGYSDSIFDNSEPEYSDSIEKYKMEDDFD